jgi:hypothetical protein
MTASAGWCNNTSWYTQAEASAVHHIRCLKPEHILLNRPTSTIPSQKRLCRSSTVSYNNSSYYRTYKQKAHQRMSWSYDASAMRESHYDYLANVSCMLSTQRKTLCCGWRHSFWGWVMVRILHLVHGWWRPSQVIFSYHGAASLDRLTTNRIINSCRSISRPFLDDYVLWVQQERHYFFIKWHFLISS